MNNYDSLHTHHSFIVRCWLDEANQLHGSLIDALTQRSYPFVSVKELVGQIEQLSAAVNPPGGEKEKENR